MTVWKESTVVKRVVCVLRLSVTVVNSVVKSVACVEVIRKSVLVTEVTVVGTTTVTEALTSLVTVAVPVTVPVTLAVRMFSCRTGNAQICIAGASVQITYAETNVFKLTIPVFRHRVNVVEK